MIEMHIVRSVALDPEEADGPHYWRLWCTQEGCLFTALVEEEDRMTVLAEHLRAVYPDETPDWQVPDTVHRQAAALRVGALIILGVILAIALWATWMSGAAW